MAIKLTSSALFVLYQLRQANFEAFMVGGAVRDVLIGDQHATDYDFTTNAKPEEIAKLFKDSFYENKFGTVMVPVADVKVAMGLPATESKPISLESKNRIIDIAQASKIHQSLQNQISTEEYDVEIEENISLNFEITTFRSDGAYQDHRRPDSVEWGESIEEDLKRRDFTINAMALKVSDGFLTKVSKTWPSESLELTNSDYIIIDEHGGMNDLQQKLIRTVGDAEDRFKEDALRMLRAIRLASQLGYQLDARLLEAIKNQNQLLNHVSWERIRDEFLKMISSDRPKESILQLDEVGLLVHILPEVLEAKNVQQGGHHTTDVWTHSLDALGSCPSSDPIVRLSTLLHDIAKPRTFKLIDGKPTFYNHEVVGSRVAKAIATRLKLSKKDRDRVFTLVRYHMFHYQPQNTDASIRRFMKKVGLENVDDILDLREADRLGSGARKTSWRLEEMKQRMIEQLHQPMDVTDLAINGNDLMSELNVKPGPVIGVMLDKCLEMVLDDSSKNDRTTLLSFVKQELQKTS